MQLFHYYLATKVDLKTAREALLSKLNWCISNISHYKLEFYFKLKNSQQQQNIPEKE